MTVDLRLGRWQDALADIEMVDVVIARFWSKCIPVPWSGCWLWGHGCDRGGYGKFQITNHDGKPKQIHVRAHRFAHWIATGEWPEVVRHRCDVPACVNPSHLEGGTQRDNIADMDLRGRRPKARRHPGAWGERHHRSTTSLLQAQRIKELLREGVKKSIIAREAGVSRSVVYQISDGITWRWLDV